MSLEISLLPGFGWSIRNKSVYGPGSVFQGLVKINLTKAQLKNADKLRIVFHAIEQSHCSGSPCPAYCSQLFGSQRTLWRHKELPVLTANKETILPFIIQLPMVQFPPSLHIVSVKDGLSYNSDYRLSVFMDSKIEGDTPIFTTFKKIEYMPLIESSMSKEKICVTTLENCSQVPELSPSADVKLTSFDYVAGAEIPISISIKNLSKKSIQSINIKLCQIQIWKKVTTTNHHSIITNSGERRLSEVIAQRDLDVVSITSSGKITSPNDIILSANTFLRIPSDSPPTFTYSPVFLIMYQLKFSIKKRSKLRSSNFHLTDIPIRLGTLGSGIRSHEAIRVYSSFDSVFNQQESRENLLPVPKFLDCLEYEESLPLYSKDRLPDYSPALVA